MNREYRGQEGLVTLALLTPDDLLVLRVMRIGQHLRCLSPPFLPPLLTPDDLLVLRVVCVGQHLCRLVAAAARQQQAHADSRSLPRDGAVGVQHILDVLGNLLVLSAQSSQA